MFYNPKLFLKDYWNLSSLAGVALAQIFIWGYVLLNIRPGNGQLFLHYNVIFGVDLIGEWWQIYYLPLAGLMVLLANFGLSLFFYRNDKILARLLSFFTVFFHIFLAIAVYLIVGKNI